MSIVGAWLRDQHDREANGDNTIERQLWPRGKYRDGWNLEAHAAFAIHHWGVGVEYEKDVNDWAFGVAFGPVWIGLHGFRPVKW